MSGQEFDRVSLDGEMLVDDFKSISLKRWKSIRRKLLDGAPGAEPLGGRLQGLYRITSGNHRCVYEPREWQGERVAHVLEVAHRDSVYDETVIRSRWGA